MSQSSRQLKEAAHAILAPLKTLDARVSAAVPACSHHREDASSRYMSNRRMRPLWTPLLKSGCRTADPARAFGLWGMGEVYLGRDTPARPKVALKCLLASQTDGEEHAGFFTKHAPPRRSTTAMSPRSTTSSTRDPVPTSSWNTSRVRPSPRACGAGACRSRRAVHRPTARVGSGGGARRVIHRDLKPANIQLTRRRSGEGARFRRRPSAARLFWLLLGGHREQPPRRRMCKGRRAGTPAYMSPEQMLGAPTDHRADLIASASCCSSWPRVGGR